MEIYGRGTVTLFVTNLPTRLHWNSFISKKLDREGKRFGFVRFSNKQDANRAIERLNGFSLYGFRLFVSVAKFQGRTSYSRKVRNSRFRDITTQQASNKMEETKGDTCQTGKSTENENDFGEQFKQNTKCSRIIQGHVEEESLWRLSKCLVGTMTMVCSSESVMERLHNWGLGELKIKSMGGHRFFIKVPDEELLRLLEEQNWSLLEEVFMNIEKWSESFHLLERITWKIDEVIELEVGMDKFDVRIVEFTSLTVVCGNGKTGPGSKPIKKANPVVVESSSESTTDSDHRVKTINSGDNYLGTDNAFNTECIGMSHNDYAADMEREENRFIGEEELLGSPDLVYPGHNRAMQDAGFMGFKNKELINEEVDIEMVEEPHLFGPSGIKTTWANRVDSLNNPLGNIERIKGVDGVLIPGEKEQSKGQNALRLGKKLGIQIIGDEQEAINELASLEVAEWFNKDLAKTLWIVTNVATLCQVVSVWITPIVGIFQVNVEDAFKEVAACGGTFWHIIHVCARERIGMADLLAKHELSSRVMFIARWYYVRVY
ncbi:hypothetical protein GQ457_05G026490 [Hibiscus cannabinus]